MINELLIHFEARREIDIAMLRVRVVVAAEAAIKALCETLVYFIVPPSLERDGLLRVLFVA